MHIKNPKIRPWMLKKEIFILYYGLKDKRTSWIAALPAIVSIIYILSPVDMIPDIIPFFGYIDDIVIFPILLNLSIRMLPKEVLEESLVKASQNKRKLQVAFFFFIF